LQQLACLGILPTLPAISIVSWDVGGKAHAALWPSVRQELLSRLAGAYKFVHDRIQEAAIADHRGVARRAPPSNRETARGTHPYRKAGGSVFDLVNQLNRGAALIKSGEEREQLAELT